jgi:alpha/beta hydrolase fold
LEITHKFLTTNGINMHVAMAGEGPIVLLCHGFPESWYSWRHQLKALAKAGYCAVAPDMRGYGQTDKPEAIDQYTLLHLTGDMVGLVEALGSKGSGHRGTRLGRTSGLAFGPISGPWLKGIIQRYGMKPQIDFYEVFAVTDNTCGRVELFKEIAASE